ncbi:MAG TPA: HlyD family efflux transporter periplasmic adaptor subunit [Dehalococcoidia bacterium]|nr:HlyD family efflux transporter periplasmic adaptor subunit [Dehalococcoidia bacterium]
MRALKIIMAILVLGSIGLASLSCNGDANSEAGGENQIATVQRGDLTVDITASGNLALSVTEDLAFDIPGTIAEITVAEVLVEEGDSVEEGQLLAKLDTSEWNDMLIDLKRDLLQAEIDLKNAELTLEEAEEDTYITPTGDVREQYTDPDEIDILEMRLELAEARFEDAQEALEEANEKSPEIIAPFDGFVTAVNVDGGDEVKTGTVAVAVADPNKFEADILVSEMDIMDVELGGTAWVKVDAIEGLSLPAEVVHISPTATIQSGVVNYQVKVEVKSMEAVMQERQGAMPDISSGEIPEPIRQAIEEGQMTQEEAEAMLEQMQAAREERQAAFEDVQLREGLTVTVSVIVDERADVLLVPNGALTTQGGQTSVQVVLPDGTIEQHTVTTGISDWQYTEVTEGLSEGEQVVVPQGTAATSTTEREGPPGRMIVPMGPPPR